MSRRILETSLYSAVKAYLKQLGFEAKGEVLGCDVVAVRAGDTPCLVSAEMKAGLTLELVLQGVDRAAAGDEVWLADPAHAVGVSGIGEPTSCAACSASGCAPLCRPRAA